MMCMLSSAPARIPSMMTSMGFAGLERALESMRNDWEGILFAVVPYKETGTYVVGGIDEIQALLDDQAVRVAAVRSSPFVGHVVTAAEKWADFIETLQVNFSKLSCLDSDLFLNGLLTVCTDSLHKDVKHLAVCCNTSPFQSIFALYFFHCTIQESAVPKRLGRC